MSIQPSFGGTVARPGERLAASDGILGRVRRVDALGVARGIVISHQREESMAEDGAESAVERAAERVGLSGHGGHGRHGGQVRARIDRRRPAHQAAS